MAVKKKNTSKANGATASPTKAAPKKAAPKKKAATSAVAETTAKVGTPKAASTKKGATKAAPKKAAAPIKLSDSQKRLLETIHASKEQGYLADKKGESKTLEALQGKKLIKRGAKDKTSGAYRYTVSKAGEKHLSSSSPPA
jgi:hypothetical protein